MSKQVEAKTDLAIQIVNFDTKGYLADLLTDIERDLHSSSLRFEVNILDNDSSDNLSDLKDQYRGKERFHFFSADENRGFGAGQNFLAFQTEAEFLLILNPDIKFIEENTIDRLAEKMRNADPEVKVIGPALVTDAGSAQKWDHGDTFLFSEWASPHYIWRPHQTPTEVAWVSGATLILSRETFKEVEGFDERFFLYVEEEDLCLRIRQDGGKVIYDPSVKVMHYGSVVSHKTNYKWYSMEKFIDKHYKSRPHYPVLKLSHKITGYS